MSETMGKSGGVEIPKVFAPLLQRAEEAEEQLRQMTELAELRRVEKEAVERAWAQMLTILEQHEERNRYRSGITPVERLQATLRIYQDAAIRSIDSTKRFRDDVLINLRAVALIADSVGSASTHREKDARLRGLIELLEGSCQRLQQFDFDLLTSAWRGDWTSPFRSDYPSRELYRRIHELEAELQDYKKAEPVADPDPAEIPF